MQKLLLHVCCAPCASSVIERLKKENLYNITLFFSNSNILPEEEYKKRKQALIDFVEEVHPEIPIIFDEYNIGEFRNSVKGLEELKEGSIRCDACILFRLNRTAEYAKNNGYDVFATTLTVSPHKNAEKINEIGNTLADKYKINYLESNFKKQNGYLRSIELCKEYNIYRQTYCGCNNFLDIIK